MGGPPHGDTGDARGLDAWLTDQWRQSRHTPEKATLTRTSVSRVAGFEGYPTQRVLISPAVLVPQKGDILGRGIPQRGGYASDHYVGGERAWHRHKNAGGCKDDGKAKVPLALGRTLFNRKLRAAPAQR